MIVEIRIPDEQHQPSTRFPEDQTFVQNNPVSVLAASPETPVPSRLFV